MPLKSNGLSRLEIPLPSDWLAAIDAARHDGEHRTEFVRGAIEAELRRRNRKVKLSPAPKMGRPKRG